MKDSLDKTRHFNRTPNRAIATSDKVRDDEMRSNKLMRSDFGPCKYHCEKEIKKK